MAMQMRCIRRTEGRAGLAGLTLVLSLLAGLACEKKGTPSDPGGSSDGSDAGGYAPALASANAFCRAWQSQDYLAAKKLFSAALLERHAVGRLVSAVQGATNHKHVAYEISRGRRLEDGRYEFPVRLYVRYTGQMSDRQETIDARVVVVSDAAGLWRLDEIPM